MRYKKGTVKNVIRFAGDLKNLDIDWDAKENRMREFRESFNKRVKETSKKMKEYRKLSNL